MPTSTAAPRPAPTSLLLLADVHPFPDTAPVGDGPAGRDPRPTGGGRRRSVLAMLAGGLTLMAAAALSTQISGTDTGGSAAAPESPPAVAVAPSPAASVPAAMNLSPGDISVVTQVYEPGQTSGWHSHAGIHAVAILSGSLTVYDAECRPQTFGRGEPHIGGQQPHLVVNETTAPVEMVTTYVGSSAGDNLTPSQAPAVCQVGR